LRLTVLGSSGTWPNDGTATSGYLLQHDGFNLYLDAGTGTLANLQLHIDLPEIHAIAITHEHPDHFVDLCPTFYALFYGELAGPGCGMPTRLRPQAGRRGIDRQSGGHADRVRVPRRPPGDGSSSGRSR
jgi:L-ascorbate metabolism protein UlaG (beta-lactamase superfamily)